MKVENPRWNRRGEVDGCDVCPLDTGIDDDTLCCKWWYRHGEDSDLVCPTSQNYLEACQLAEDAK